MYRHKQKHMDCPECKQFGIKQKLEKDLIEDEIVIHCELCGYEEVIIIDNEEEDL